MRLRTVLYGGTGLLSFIAPVASQQIYDIFQTTWDRSKSFTSLKPSSPINFAEPTVNGDAAISVDDDSVYQNIYGFGGSLTDSSAKLFNALKSKNSNNYNALLNTLFSPTDGGSGAGLTYVRVPLGASDFSASEYSFDDSSGDTDFSDFNINAAPSYLFSVLKDIIAVNSQVKVHLLPWSPPGWMKDSGTMKGGSIKSQYLDIYPQYLLKSLQGFKSNGINNLYAISIQNEPQNSNPTYPTSTWTYQQEAQVGKALRTLMNNNGFSGVKLIGYEHNWNNAATYPVNLIKTAPDAFAGVAFHCYSGSVSQQDSFHNAYPNKEIYFSECAGTIGSDYWEDIKWYSDNIFIGSVQHSASVGLMWALALDGTGEPRFPGTDSCGNGCRGIVTINSDGSYTLNQEFYAMAHASKAIIPKDSGGPFGKRIGNSVSGTLNWALRVNAFVTERTSSSDWLRYSLVVMNYDDKPDGTWNPTPVQTTIEFRGQQAVYSFPVGLTTLWWYAAKPSFNGTSEEPLVGYGETSGDGSQQTFQWMAKDDY